MNLDGQQRMPMSMETLDHVTISTNDLEATRQFYCDILGMKEGFRPETIAARVSGLWLYTADDKPRLHIIVCEDSVPHGSAAINHFAFNARDCDKFLRRLDTHGISFRGSHLPEIEIYQVFFYDPQGIMIEVTFRGNERPKAILDGENRAVGA